MIPLISTYGGRAERYKETPNASYRVFDPVRSDFLQFRTPLHGDNFITQRFRTGVKKIEVFNTPVRFVTGDSSAMPSLRVTLESGSTELHVVVHYAANSNLIPAVRRMARTEGALCVVRDLDTVRSPANRLDDLDYLLQAATSHADHAAELGEAILQRVPASRTTTVSELQAVFSHYEKDVVDGAIATLHARGKGVINFVKGVAYGQSEFSVR